MTTPWLSVMMPIQPSKPERMRRLTETLHKAVTFAAQPGLIHWMLLPQEGKPWTLGEKQRHAIRTCPTPWLLMLSDDVSIETPLWDMHFKASTHDPNALILWGNDGRLRERLAVSACLRTDFARFILPILEPFDHYLIDDAWHDVARRVHGLRYLPQVDALCWEATRRVPYNADLHQYAIDSARFVETEPDRVRMALEWAQHVAGRANVPSLT